MSGKIGSTIAGTWIPGTDGYRIDGKQVEALRREGFEFKANPDTTEAYLVAPVGYHGNCLSFAKESEALESAPILAGWLAKPVRVVGRRNGAQGEIARFTPLPDQPRTQDTPTQTNHPEGVDEGFRRLIFAALEEGKWVQGTDSYAVPGARFGELLAMANCSEGQ